MDMLLFCTAFILQFVGHRVGDYMLQTHTQSINKGKDFIFLLKHSYIYSVVTSAFLLFAFGIDVFIIVLFLTFFEHMWIDSRKPVIAWKNFIERKLAGNKKFETDDMPFFVLIEIDQSIHILRIFILSVLIGYGVI